MKNILVFPAGTEVGLEIYRQLRFTKGVHLIGASSNSDHADFVYKEIYNDFPSIYNEEAFFPFLGEFCTKKNISIIIPAHDEVIYKISQNLSFFNSSTKVLSPKKELASILRYKSRTYRVLEKIVRVPVMFEKCFIEKNEVKFPLFSKPDNGQGSRGTMKINNIDEFKSKSDIFNNSYIFTEFLPGEEFTVDCFSTNNKLIIANPRRRTRVSNGISVRTENVNVKNLDSINEIALKINNCLNISGPWFFQVKKDVEGNFCLLEIANRIAGSSSFTHHLGFNLMEASIYMLLGYEIYAENILNRCVNNMVVDRALDSVCKIEYDYDTVYIDFDDTIIINGQINSDIVKFLYEQVSKNKFIVLITRHASEIKKTLKKYRLLAIFDKIIHLKANELKSVYIKKNNAIFIDDSFSERLEVKTNCDILVFDPSMICSILL